MTTAVRARNSYEIAVIEGLVDPPKTHSIEAIEAGIRKYYQEQGKTPSQKSGDAEPYVGYKANWEAVNAWLRSNGHGSLFQLCKKMGFDPYYASHSIEAIRSGVQRFHKEHGKAPFEKSGDASSYVGYKTSWRAVSGWLRNNGHGSLHKLCKKMGFEPYHAPHSLKVIKIGIRKFHKEHRKTPSEKRGDASSYVGYKTTWLAVNHWLRNNGHGSLSQLCQNMGLERCFAHHSLKAIQKGVRKYYEEHGKVPSQKYGDAEPYMGYKATWRAVDQWLRKNGHGSLPQLCQEMGLGSLRAKHSFKAIKAGIRRYHKEHEKVPSKTSGDAEPYMGYKATWMAVNDWLKQNGHGSLPQLCKKMELK